MTMYGVFAICALDSTSTERGTGIKGGFCDLISRQSENSGEVLRIHHGLDCLWIALATLVTLAFRLDFLVTRYFPLSLLVKVTVVYTKKEF